MGALNELITNCKVDGKGFYDKAFVALNDKIIPTKNQLKSWHNLQVEIVELADGHFPFYNFKSWKELCK